VAACAFIARVIQICTMRVIFRYLRSLLDIDWRNDSFPGHLLKAMRIATSSAVRT
jgi:hypothetical protein